MSSSRSALVEYVQTSLRTRADPEKAGAMQAYMRTTMPFYVVLKPGRVEILRHIKGEFPPSGHEDYERLVIALWELPHREEKYLAQAFAGAFPAYIVPGSLPLYRRFIVEGGWWDLVDETATHLVRPPVVGYPEETWPIVDRWIDSEDMWLRRAAIICQVGARTRADADRLLEFCRARAHEKEFFIRKAIGWALRDYARTDPGAVARFVTENRDRLACLSFREATKHIGDLVS